ncbi:molybdopterin-dependent oxidoreductase [Luteimonas sp. FCS-9]|uniref:molybdopterin-dependent oxidoreductase n=1 Tax=Luteimonas sp. FCS-9 TaxID=1547516 RepID=UPI00069C99FF|nr:molybdopterin-dependent oxidoreductase [Luteimonas sp. FCS-9]
MILPRRLLPALLLPLCTAAAAQGPDAHAHASPPPAASPQVVPLDAAARATLQRRELAVDDHGRPRRCEGVSLAGLLRASGAMPDAPQHGGPPDRYVLVTARDGYRALFSLAELDPTLGDRIVLLADRCNGRPLDAADGPLRLLVADDARAARSVRQVERIVVVTAP